MEKVSPSNHSKTSGSSPKPKYQRTAPWTAEEDERLSAVVKKMVGAKKERSGESSSTNTEEVAPSWRDVAVLVGNNRDGIQCLRRYKKLLAVPENAGKLSNISLPGAVRGKWTEEEDQKLAELVSQYSDKKWSKISTGLPGRKAKSCRERWVNHLNPDICKTPWSRAEDRILLEGLLDHGTKWADISKLLPGRPENQIKNRWYSSMKRKVETFIRYKNYDGKHSLMNQDGSRYLLQKLDVGNILSIIRRETHLLPAHSFKFHQAASYSQRQLKQTLTNSTHSQSQLNNTAVPKQSLSNTAQLQQKLKHTALLSEDRKPPSLPSAAAHPHLSQVKTEARSHLNPCKTLEETVASNSSAHRSLWTPALDELLKRAVVAIAESPERIVLKIGDVPGVVVNWIDVAKTLSRGSMDQHAVKKTSAQCLRRYKKLARQPQKYGPMQVIAVQVNGKWTDDEDAKLAELVLKFQYKWSQISADLPGRNAKSCRERWVNHLSPNICKSPWTEEEDLILLKGLLQLGNKWAEIAKLLPGRSDSFVKNHWHASVKFKVEMYIAQKDYDGCQRLMDPTTGRYLLLGEDDIEGALQAVRGASSYARVDRVAMKSIQERSKQAVLGSTTTSASATTNTEAISDSSNMDEQYTTTSHGSVLAENSISNVSANLSADESWTARLQELKENKDKHGDCNFSSASAAKNLALAKWVKIQRAQYNLFMKGEKKSRLSQEQINALDALEVYSGANYARMDARRDHDEQWLIRFKQLIGYRLDHGNCNVPNKFVDNQKLGYWTHRQRVQYRLYAEGKKSRLTEEKFTLLDNIGFISSSEKQAVVKETASSAAKQQWVTVEEEEEVPQWEVEW